MSDRCHCTGCKVCDRKNDRCRRSIVHTEDHLCEECHRQAEVIPTIKLVKEEKLRRAG